MPQKFRKVKDQNELKLSEDPGDMDFWLTRKVKEGRTVFRQKEGKPA